MTRYLNQPPALNGLSARNSEQSQEVPEGTPGIASIRNDESIGVPRSKPQEATTMSDERIGQHTSQQPDGDAAVSTVRRYQQSLQRGIAEARQKYLQQLQDPQKRLGLKQSRSAWLLDSSRSATGELGISEAQLSRLIELQVEQILQTDEDTGGSATSQQYPVPVAEIAAEFGSTIAAGWAQYYSELPARLALRSVTAKMTEAGVPISGDQYRSLVKMYASATLAVRTLPQGDITSGVQGQLGEYLDMATVQREIGYRDIVSGAASFLSPKQAEILRSQLESETAGMRLAADYIRSEK
jgi:hypothetical protein